MLISLDWLRQYVDIEEEPRRLAEDLTMLGLNVEGVEHRPNPFAPLRIGRVLTCERHPNADRLSVCTVDIGEAAPRDIVCGAPNVRAGQEVPIIPAGEPLPDGTVIKKGKIRGALSEGMICSVRELGLGAEADGIMVLESGLAPGTPLSALFGHEDWILDIDVTPNRPDQLGYLGVAREVAARYERPLRLPATEIPAAALAAMEPVPVDIEDPADCPRYLARRLRDVTVGPSPAWLCRRLESMGLRPINNIVDVTNFVLFETGHPLHAFDAAKLAGGRIVIRRARPGETTVTLEEKEVALDPADLVIADAERTVCIAGVMGGANSLVTESSREIILESACFHPGLIRGTRQRLDLTTDAAYRFERGADAEMADFASRRVCRLLAELAGARVAAEPDDHYPGRAAPRKVILRVAKVNGLMGTDLDAATVEHLLERLQLPAETAPGGLAVTVPSFRRDLAAEIDLIEEVARLYGYDRLPLENRVRNTLYATRLPEERLAARLHEALRGLGCQEVIASSFMDARSLDAMRLPGDDPRRRVVVLRNPLVSFNAQMRSTLLPGMLEVLKTNFHRGQEELRLYQIGRVYRRREGTTLPDEPVHLAVLLTGHAQPAHWRQPASALGFADLMGVVQGLQDLLPDLAPDYAGDEPCLVPGAAVHLLRGEAAVGWAGLLRPSLMHDLKQKRDVFALEMDLSGGGDPGQRCFAPLPAYPALLRDLALLVPDGLPWRRVAETITEAGGRLLERCGLFDVYRGEGLPAGHASYAVRLVFRSPEGTLTDKQADKQLTRVLQALDKTLQVRLRS
ncbi:MAG: phenylalanine--tRNA ligase subunit beta [Candidatus Krumholzibacteriota bacterium]|nr:phenylalanine--tRNA ligase subunit beta [Candidatus Krumholzibacteriota bacterium]